MRDRHSMFDIAEEIEKTPQLPGVYVMKNANHAILYIGKACLLKNRIKQYFTSKDRHDIKTSVLVKQIASFSYIITNNEVEALILEDTLIKKHQPKYNILLKDDKAFPYVRIDVTQRFPTVTVVRRQLKDGAKYFGPYHIHATALKRALNHLRKIFPVRLCEHAMDVNMKTKRPCLHAQINMCAGVCTGNVSEETYQTFVQGIMDFFSGKGDELLMSLERKMHDASMDLDFETAASLRDQIEQLRRSVEKQKMVSTRLEDEDYCAIHLEYDYFCVGVLCVREGRLIDKKEFTQKNLLSSPKEEIMSSFIQQYYADMSQIPKAIYVSVMPKEPEPIEDWLKQKAERAVELRRPKQGIKKEMLDMATLNARVSLKNVLLQKKHAQSIATTGMSELAKLLHLPSLPSRIEAYDVSHSSGTHTVGVRIVYVDGKKSKDLYRRYRVQDQKAHDDYAAMCTMIERRFSAKNQEPDPDLILIDGGKGHIGAVSSTLSKMGKSIPMAGLFKDDRHRTQGIVTEHLESRLDEQPFLKTFLASIQDEVHRFAIDYHRLLSGKQMTASVLDEIPGVGPQRKKDLIQKFRSVVRIKKASISQLCEVEGISQHTAKAIRRFFHPDEE